MKTLRLNTLLALIAIGLLFGACNKTIIPSGNLTTKQYSITDYSKLDVSAAINATVEFSSTEESIVIQTDDNIQDYIKVEKKNDALIIGFEDDVNISGISTINAIIKTSEVSKFVLSGASKVTLENQLTTNNVNIDLSGASNFIGNVDVQSLACNLSGASKVDLSGSSNSFSLDASGASRIGNYDFETKTFTAKLSGASSASLTVSDGINIEASGASSLSYKGDATINQQSLSGASTVNHIQ